MDYTITKYGKNALFLHKDEWNRLKGIGDTTRDSPEKNEYIQSLIEKSQNWISAWPDSVHGHISKLDKQKQTQRANDLAMIQLFKKNHDPHLNKTHKCIEKAKQIIFDDSCYGRRLMSAFHESKTYEERDVQIEFQKKIKEIAVLEDQHNASGCSLQNAIDMENYDKEQAKCQRENDEEVARVNKAIYLTQLEDKTREKETQIKIESEDLRLVEELNKIQAVQETNRKLQIKYDLKLFEAEQKKIKDIKATREDEENKKIEIWRMYEDKKNAVMKTIHQKRFEKSQPTEIYELVKKLNEEEQHRYDEFVNKGIKTHMQRLQDKEEEDNQKRANEINRQYLLMETNKKLEHAKKLIETDKSKITCDRQCIITKYKCIPENKKLTKRQDIVTFTPLTNRLVKNLKIKAMEPSPWSGLSAVHAQFAHQAGQTLQECRYKNAARKVVDEYRRLHGLNPQNLPVANYI